MTTELEYCDISGKVRFRNPASAYKHGESMQKRSGGRLRAYKCPWCHDYHVTSQQQVFRKKRQHKK